MKAFSWSEDAHGAIVADGKRPGGGGVRQASARRGSRRSSFCTRASAVSPCGATSREDSPRRPALAFSSIRAPATAAPIRSPCPGRSTTCSRERTSDTAPSSSESIEFRRGVLVGHSDGASIAAIYAGERDDERVKGLVLMAPLFTEPAGLASIAEAKRAYETGDLKPKLARYHAHVDAAFLGWSGAGSTRALQPGPSKRSLNAGGRRRSSSRARTTSTARSRRFARSRRARPRPSKRSSSTIVATRRNSSSRTQLLTPLPRSVVAPSEKQDDHARRPDSQPWRQRGPPDRRTADPRAPARPSAHSHDRRRAQPGRPLHAQQRAPASPIVCRSSSGSMAQASWRRRTRARSSAPAIRSSSTPACRVRPASSA